MSQMLVLGRIDCSEAFATAQSSPISCRCAMVRGAGSIGKIAKANLPGYFKLPSDVSLVHLGEELGSIVTQNIR